MKIDIYQIDAFTDHIFGGNPACVVPLTEWLPDEILLKIARENAVAETAFFISKGHKFHLRWFTPDLEMDLCGHATLATAHALRTILHHPADTIVFETLSGDLSVSHHHDLYTLDFPSRKPIRAELPVAISQALNIQPSEVFKERDYMLVYESEQAIRNISINRPVFDRIDLGPGGVIVTAKGDACDFVSRFFSPQSTILEDPVTGSAHCTLIPYWSEQLGQKTMTAMQLSERVGTLFCTDAGQRVHISGKARTYSIGTFVTE
jgi:PhzF family phenazine biosynthesis protein